MPHHTLSALLGEDLFNEELFFKGDAKVEPETPLARIVHKLGLKLRWRSLNALRGSRLFAWLDAWIDDASLTRRGVTRVVRYVDVCHSHMHIYTNIHICIYAYSYTHICTLWLHNMQMCMRV
jgi:hypothetical protein